MSNNSISSEMHDLWAAETAFRTALISKDVRVELRRLETIIVLSINAHHSRIRKRGVSTLEEVAASAAVPVQVKALASAAVFALVELATATAHSTHESGDL